MSHLYPHLRIHQVFGANTDVGKTIFTTALCLASSVLPLPSSSSSHDDDVRSAIAGSSRGESVHYLKPVSTGPMTDSDDGHIARYANPSSQHTLLRFSNAVSPHLAARLGPPSASPLANLSRLPTDAELVRSIGHWIDSKASTSSSRGVAYIETAGGPHSPSPSGKSQVHLLRPLRLPTILVGDSQLGGISTTRSAYESLVAAGYDVEAILLFSQGAEDKWGNADYLAQWGEEVGVPVWGLRGASQAGPPAWAQSQQEEEQNMRNFYRHLVYGKGRLTEGGAEPSPGVVDVVKDLRSRHQSRIAELGTFARRTMDSCWWPTTQHSLAKSEADVTVIDSAHGDFFSTFKQQQGDDAASTSLLAPMLDGSASWWTQCLGHSHPRLAQVAAQAAGRYGHVLFPMAANEPALKLAEGLLGRLPEQQQPAGETHAAFPSPGSGWADRVFYSDDGSTGMEVALKMAIAAARTRYAPAALTPASTQRAAAGREAGSIAGRPEREWKVLGLKGSYHGDTIGAMDASEPSVYSNMVHWYRGRGEWIEPPQVSVVNGVPTVKVPGGEAGLEWDKADGSHSYSSLQAVYDVPSRLSSDPLAKTYRAMISAWLDRVVRLEGNRFGALLMEPLVLGAAGMIFVDPLFQRVLVDVVRESESLFALSDAPLRDATAARSAPCGDGEWKGLPVVFDEVFAGLYRLGPLSPSLSVLGVKPDISCLAKILTGGLVPMAVTLASRSIYETFLSARGKKEEALLHGHSYTAHAIGCEVARETLHILGSVEQDSQRGQGGGSAASIWRQSKAQWADDASVFSPGRPESQSSPSIWSLWSPQYIADLSRSSPRVEHTMTLGSVLVVKLRNAEGEGGYGSTAAQDIVRRLRTGLARQMGHPSQPESDPGKDHSVLPFNVHARPLGDILYIMCSLDTSDEVRQAVQDVLRRELAA